MEAKELSWEELLLEAKILNDADIIESVETAILEARKLGHNDIIDGVCFVNSESKDLHEVGAVRILIDTAREEEKDKICEILFRGYRKMKTLRAWSQKGKRETQVRIWDNRIDELILILSDVKNISYADAQLILGAMLKKEEDKS